MAPNGRDGMENEHQPRDDFLACLPRDTGQHAYSGLAQMDKIISAELNRCNHEQGSQFIVFTGVSPAQFDEEIVSRQKWPKDYKPSLETLIIKMPQMPHEVAIQFLAARIAIKANKMGVTREIMATGQSEIRAPDRVKASAASYRPRFRPRANKWPTVAIEVAWSESREKVQRDVEWWLNAAEGRVQQAISVDIKRGGNNTIYITAWERHSNPEARAVQNLSIHREGQAGPYVVGGKLTIPFEHFLLRKPNRETGENDWIFEESELLEMAEEVWEVIDIPT